MNIPLISIIIPTYNRAHLIGDTLDSILGQTYEKWECIVVDDASTDNTRDLLSRYCDLDNRILFYKRPDIKPKGANACRNYGLELCKGEFVLFYDSDDIMLEDKLDTHIGMFKEHVNTEATITNSYYYNFKTEKRVKPWRNKLTSNNLITEFILQETGWQTGDALWKTKVLSNLKFNEDLHSSQDWEFHIKALCLDKKLKFKDVCMSYIRHTPKSIKNSFTIQKIKSDFLSRKNVVDVTKRKDVLETEAACKILKEFYKYFEVFLSKRVNKYMFKTFKEILKLTIMLKSYSYFFKSFCIVYPMKFLKKIF